MENLRLTNTVQLLQHQIDRQEVVTLQQEVATLRTELLAVAEQLEQLRGSPQKQVSQDNSLRLQQAVHQAQQETERAHQDMQLQVSLETPPVLTSEAVLCGNTEGNRGQLQVSWPSDPEPCSTFCCICRKVGTAGHAASSKACICAALPGLLLLGCRHQVLGLCARGLQVMAISAESKECTAAGMLGSACTNGPSVEHTQRFLCLKGVRDSACCRLGLRQRRTSCGGRQLSTASWLRPLHAP